MTNLQKLTQAIQTICPELLELKFGCKIKIIERYNDFFEEVIKEKYFLFTGIYKEEKSTIIVRGIGINNGKLLRDEALYYLETKRKNPTIIPKNFEILGSDITLEHVLKAIGNHERMGDYDISSKEIVFDDFETDYRTTLFSWKLGLPLHSQSQETIDALTNLICK